MIFSGRVSGLVWMMGAVLLAAVAVPVAPAQTLTTLGSFDGTNGALPFASLIADANGNLFGTTSEGGRFGAGTVFEIVKTAGGYASTPTVLASFDGTSARHPLASLIADANGNLFGTTGSGPLGNGTVFGYGTVFEIVRRPGAMPAHQRLGQLRWNQCRTSVCQSDCRRQRQPLRHDTVWRGIWLRYGIRDRQDGRGLCQHAHRFGQLRLEHPSEHLFP